MAKVGRPRKDWTGARFGWIEALSPVRVRDQGGNLIWLMLCHSCGRTFERDSGRFGRYRPYPKGEQHCGCRTFGGSPEDAG
jgi:hypothetical protein